MLLKRSELRSARPRATKAKRRATGSVGIALGVFAFAGMLAAPLQAKPANKLLVQTKEGPVKGFLNNGVAEFLGIPYAAPPVGNLRWRPPEPHAPWPTVLQATSFGSNCPQKSSSPFAGPANTTNEDCLFINVFTPEIGKGGGHDDANRGRDAKLPVIFWMHGGGNSEGESSDYDGSKMAVKGHVVVVTINYRLGALGWMAAPALDSEGHLFANYGLLDQQAALKWVQRNIAKFGGDPNNITVGGQSTGSIDVEANMVSPLAKGLFQRAIFMSDINEVVTLATAEALGATFANVAGCTQTASSEIAACLRALSVAQIMALPGGAPYPFTGDGTILPLEPATVSPTQPGGIYLAFESGHYNHMPVMSGTTEDEENFFLASQEYTTQTPYSAAQYAAAIAAFPATVTPFTAPLTVRAWVAAHYPLLSSTPPGPQLSADALFTPDVYDEPTCPQHRINKLIATGPSPSPVYAYEFDDRTAPFYFPKFKFPFESLAYHTSDIQYVFGNPSGTVNFHGGPTLSVIHPFNRVQKILSDQMVTAWTNFAWTGNPNGLGSNPWPRYRGSKPNSYYLLENILPTGLSTQTDAQFVARHNCDFWDSYLTP